MTSQNQNDFAPEVRNSAMWSGDARKIANGKVADVILEKQLKKPIPDLSDIEEVQMGKKMERIIAQLFTEKHKIQLDDADYVLSHPKENWMKSHFDYVFRKDGKPVLVEAKNYNMAVMNKFDEEYNVIPNSDMAQLIHEATVHQTDEIYLAVLFGGQKFRTFHFKITDEMKLDHIKALAEVWGHVKAGTLPEADTVENSKLIYPLSIDEAAMASQSVEKAVEALKNYKAKISALEAEMEQIEVAVRNYMGDKGSLMTVDGRTLVTWKNSKASMKFDTKLFQQSMPDLYEKYMVETMGSRRFLIK